MGTISNTYESFFRLKERTIEILGEAFFLEMIRHSEDRIKRAGNTFETHSLVHPLFNFWREFSQFLELKEKDNSIGLSRNALRFVDIAYCLSVIADLENHERILEKIRNENSFFSGLYEAKIAAAYRSIGSEIVILDESVPGGSCDFVVRCSQEDVSIECKSIDDLLTKHARKWQEICIRICNYLSDRKFELDVRISSTAAPTEKLVSNIIEDLGLHLPNSTVPFTRSLLGITYTVDKCNAKLEQLNEKPPPWPGGYGYVEFNITPLNNGLVKYFPCCASVDYEPDRTVIKRIIRSLKKAVTRLPSSSASLVYIDLGSSHGNDYLRTIDTGYRQIENVLASDTTRVNLVVLTSSILQKHKSMPINFHNYMIPNRSSKFNLPEDFKIYGHNKLFESFDPITSFFEFEVDIDVDEFNGENISNVIFSHISPDAKLQVLIWITWKNRIRFEVTSVHHGRLIAETGTVSGFRELAKFKGGWWFDENKIDGAIVFEDDVQNDIKLRFQQQG